MSVSDSPRLRFGRMTRRPRTLIAACVAVVAIAASTLGPVAAQAQAAAPSVTDVAVSSNAGSDQTYALGETMSSPSASARPSS